MRKFGTLETTSHNCINVSISVGMERVIQIQQGRVKCIETVVKGFFS